jgi:hypothetical protein
VTVTEAETWPQKLSNFNFIHQQEQLDLHHSAKAGCQHRSTTHCLEGINLGDICLRLFRGGEDHDVVAARFLLSYGAYYTVLHYIQHVYIDDVDPLTSQIPAA